MKFLIPIFVILFLPATSFAAQLASTDYVDRTYIQISQKNVSGGVAGLNESRKIDIDQVPVGNTTETVAAGDDARIVGAVQKTGDETINGVKTFNEIPLIPTATLPTLP